MANNPPSGHPRQGECRRKSPILVPVMVAPNPLIPNAQPEQKFMGIFPPTFGNMWCAEWSQKTEGNA
jgi:hypothetical protein